MIFGNPRHVTKPLGIKDPTISQHTNFLAGMLEQTANREGFPNENFTNLVEIDALAQPAFTGRGFASLNPHPDYVPEFQQLKWLSDSAAAVNAQIIRTYINKRGGPLDFNAMAESGFYPPHLLSNPNIIIPPALTRSTLHEGLFPVVALDTEVLATFDHPNLTCQLDVFLDGSYQDFNPAHSLAKLESLRYAANAVIFRNLSNKNKASSVWGYKSSYRAELQAYVNALLFTPEVILHTATNTFYNVNELHLYIDNQAVQVEAGRDPDVQTNINYRTPSYTDLLRATAIKKRLKTLGITTFAHHVYSHMDTPNSLSDNKKAKIKVWEEEVLPRWHSARLYLYSSQNTPATHNKFASAHFNSSLEFITSNNKLADTVANSFMKLIRNTPGFCYPRNSFIHRVFANQFILVPISQIKFPLLDCIPYDIDGNRNQRLYALADHSETTAQLDQRATDLDLPLPAHFPLLIPARTETWSNYPSVHAFAHSAFLKRIGRCGANEKKFTQKSKNQPKFQIDVPSLNSLDSLSSNGISSNDAIVLATFRSIHKTFHSSYAKLVPEKPRNVNTPAASLIPLPSIVENTRPQQFDLHDFILEEIKPRVHKNFGHFFIICTRSNSCHQTRCRLP
jgi:hypothetical protein